MASSDKSEFLHGTLEMLVLRILAEGEENGFAIVGRIRALSSNVLTVEEGSLYPALYRMERRGWLAPRWGTSENNRRAKFYRITRTGRRQLRERTEGWAEFTAGVAGVMEPR